MARYIDPSLVKGIFREFWDKDYSNIYLSMAGLADIWEGPGGYQNSYSGAGTILGMQYYNDRLYIVQGGGLQTFVKVISPNGVEIHMIGTQACLITHTAMDVYGTICVINENELIVGYLYVNLDLQFATPYGLNLAQLWDNPTVKITSARVSSSGWVSVVRSAGSIQLFLHQKASPEDCLPCSTKEAAAIGSTTKFSCKEENYSREANYIDSYRASRSMMTTGANMSVTDMGGMGLYERKPLPRTDAFGCLRSMDEYVAVFNKARISPTDVGEVGQKMSRSCTKNMYGNMLQTIQYKKETELMHDKYIESFIKGEEDNEKLASDSVAMLGLITPFLSEIAGTVTDNDMLRAIFSDQIWWSAIWFANNTDKFVGIEDRLNPYTLLQTVGFEDFMDMLINAASNIPPLEPSQPLPMGWVIMSDKDTNPVKYSKTSMTYFRFPFSICMSTTKLGELPERDFDSICDVETRPDGVIIWAWLDRSTLNNRMYMELRCYKISNDGVIGLLDTKLIGHDASPVDNSAKTVTVGDDCFYVRDYFLKTSSGGIDYVETKVLMSGEMRDIANASNAGHYSNTNEISGMAASSKGTVHYSDGMLETDYEPYDLDDGFVGVPAWGNDGKQYDWVSGYSGYQIHTADLL